MSTSGLCWADEVEKEEEEEHRNHRQKRDKPNHFASARPREVVLQEKGVDRRKLGHKLHHHQPSSSRKDKQTKQKFSSPPRATSEGRRFGSGRKSGNLLDSPGYRNRNDDLFVPPLRYPPKNVMGLLKKGQWPSSAELYRGREREDRVHERVVERSDRNADPYERDFEWEKERPVLENGRGFGERDFGHQGRALSVHRERDWEGGSRYDRRHGLEDRVPGPIPVHGRRGGVDEVWGDRAGEYKRRSRSPSVRDLPNGGRLRFDSPKRDAGFGGNHRNDRVRPLEERGVENMEHLYGRQRFDSRDYGSPWRPPPVSGPHNGRRLGYDHENTEECGVNDMDYSYGRRGDTRDFDDPRTGRVDRGRVEDHKDMKMEKEVYDRENKRRGLFEEHRVEDRGRVEDHKDMKMEKEVYDRENKRRGLFEEHRVEEMKYQHGKQRFDAKDFGGPRTGRLDRGWAEDHNDSDRGNAVAGQINKRRGMNLGSNNRHDHQRRRR